MFQPTSNDAMPRPQQADKRRDEGLASRVSARALWEASEHNRSARERRRALLRFVLLGEREDPVPAHRGPVEPPGATGISCSGSGMRSAAFNLGALQALQRDGALAQADYLAAVSGGAYVAAAFCMVGKTATSVGADDGAVPDDSDPRLLDRTPPFAPGTPEEQYLRTRSAYIAPGLTGKTYVALRLLLGLLFNVCFLALPLIGLALLGYVFFYEPLYGGLGDHVELPTATWLFPTLIAAAGVAIGLWRIVRRPPSDTALRFSEVWSVRLLGVAAIAATITVALPVVVGAMPDDLSLSLTDPTVGGPGAGITGLIAGLVACLRDICVSPRRAALEYGRARGWLARQNTRLRSLIIQAAATIAGPLLLVMIVAETLALAAGSPHGAALLLAAAAALGLFALLYCVTDLTSWSLHPFYKRRLNAAFALKRVLPARNGADDRRAGIPQEHSDGIALEREFDRHVALSETALCTGPTLVICAAARISDPGATPPGRRGTSLTFSAQTIGGPLIGGLQTARFEQAFEGTGRRRDLTLPAAIAMSGAGLAPPSSRVSRGSWRVLMTLANLRLGVWVPNPRWVAGTDASQRQRHKRPRPWYLLLELLGRSGVDGRYLYVTDGANYESLGLVELLRRGCTRIYCFDGGAGRSFSELGDAIALARSELGVEIDIDPSPLTPAGDPAVAQTDCVTGTLRYASGETGTLVYARAVMSPSAPWDVRAQQQAEPRFPHDPWIDQLSAKRRFESYRALGEAAGVHALAQMRPPARTSSRRRQGKPAAKTAQRGMAHAGVQTPVAS